MECYEGATMIKTFRGLITNNTQDTIVLHTNNGSTGYRIVKFQVINQNPTTQNVEAVLKITSVSVTPTLLIDFSDGDILAVAHYTSGEASNTNPVNETVIFDAEIFNQDIYISSIGQGANIDGMNYYLELEQMKLDLSESTVATLKDVRSVTTPT